jgi:hypothetical protein
MQFHSYPEYISIRHYQENIEAYTAHLKNLKEVLGLFSMGSISAPGLSDIDLIVVVRNEIPHSVTLSPFDLNLDRRLFQHDVFVLNLKLVKNFDYIYYPTNIEPIFMKNDILISFPSLYSISEELKLIYLIELGRMKLEQLCAISRSGKCNIRKLITRVSSIIHSLNIAGELSIEVPESVKAYRDRILSLRSNWAKNAGTSIHHIDEIFDDGLKCWCRILEAASKKFGQMDGINCNEQPSTRKFINIRFSDRNCCRLVKDRRGRYRQVFLPKNIYYHYEGYRKPGESKYHREQVKRLNLIMEHRRFLKKTGLTFSMSGNPGIPINTMEKVALRIKGIRSFISGLKNYTINKRT